jgi:hypothetical protein
VQHVALEVEFRIYGPAGDHVKVRTWGEGIDAGDKATSKAHTAALKNGLLPAFMIPTHNLTVDGDSSGPTAAVPAPPAASDAAPVPDAERRISAPQKARLTLELARLGADGQRIVREALVQLGRPTDEAVLVDDLTYHEAAVLLAELARPQTDDGVEAAPAADVPPVEAAEGSPAPAASAPSSARRTKATS